MKYQAVIFDLDGVIVSTDEYHYQAWKYLADLYGIDFDRKKNERLRGVSRMECLEILLENSDKEYSIEKRNEMAELKNNYYKDLLNELTPNHILRGVMTYLDYLKNQGIKIAVASSSKNAKLILKQIGLSDYFNTVMDGEDIKHSKPHPEVFLKAASHLGVKPNICLVVEDADAGVLAAIRANMDVMKIGEIMEVVPTYQVNDLTDHTCYELLR